jgi:hypothetical protein
VLLGAQWYEVGESRFGVSAALGYTVGHGAAAGVAGDGLVVDAAVLYSMMSVGGLFLDLHTRVGIEGRSEDVRAVFLSVGGRQIFR